MSVDKPGPAAAGQPANRIANQSPVEQVAPETKAPPPASPEVHAPDKWSPKGIGRGLLEAQVAKAGAPTTGQVHLSGSLLPVVNFDALLKGSVQLGTPNTRGWTELVAGDVRRADHATKTGETWALAKGEVNVGAGFDLAGSLTLGPSMGMTRNFKVSFLAAYPTGPGAAADKTPGAFAHDALKTITFPDTSKTLKSLKWAPGSEMVLETMKDTQKGLDVLGPVVTAGMAFVEPYAGISKDDKTVFTKHFKQVGQHRGDDVYFVQVGKLVDHSTDYHVGVRAGPSISIAPKRAPAVAVAAAIPATVAETAATPSGLPPRNRPATLSPNVQPTTPNADGASGPDEGDATPLPGGVNSQPPRPLPTNTQQTTPTSTPTDGPTPATPAEASPDQRLNLAVANVSAGYTKGKTHEVMANGIFNLNKPEEAAQFDAFNQLDVPAAAEWIRANQGNTKGAAVAVVDGKQGALHAEASLVGVKVLSISNSTEDKTAVVFRAGEGETKLAEKTKAASREGFLYQITNEGAIGAFGDGVQRTVQASAGTIERPGKAPTKAVQVALDLRDSRLLQHEGQEWERFAAGMGTELRLPDKDLGTANIGVSAAFDDAQIKSLIAKAHSNPEQVMSALTRAQAQISGMALPPWAENAKNFEFYAGLPREERPHDYSRDKMRHDYKFDFPGRDLDMDASLYETAQVVTKALAEMPNDDLEAFSALLDAVSQQYSRDVRTVLLGLKNLSGAELMRLDVKAKGVDIALRPTVASQDRLGVEVGRLMALPDPDAR